METRQITQIHIFYLVLNGVYHRCEGRNIVAVSDELSTIISLYNNNLLPPEERYRDDLGRYRSFREGPLHDYNPVPFQLYDVTNYDNLGIKDTWVNEDEIYNLKNKYHWF